MEKYFIIPTNEGQDLNYMEDFQGTMVEARKRAFVMRRALRRILKQGTIDVRIEMG